MLHYVQYVLVVKHIEGITNVTLCAICTGCETHRGNNKRYIMCNMDWL